MRLINNFSLISSILVEKTEDNVVFEPIGNESELSWYAFYTMPRCEKKVTERLLKLGWEVYLPLLDSIRQWSDRKKRVQLPLIPSIVFVRTTPSSLPEVLVCEGVVRVLRYLKRPALVRDVEIAHLRILLKEPDTIDLIAGPSDLTLGVKVRVVRGPFAGIVGTCIRLQGRNQLVVEIGALNRQIKLTLPVSFIEKERVPLVYHPEPALI